LIHVTLHLFFGAPQLPEAVLDRFDARRGLCILKCVMIVLFHSGLSFTKPPVNRLDRKPSIELTGELQEEMRVNEVLQERVKILLTELGADLPKTVAGFFLAGSAARPTRLTHVCGGHGCQQLTVGIAG
jgi:hypothetical protein